MKNIPEAKINSQILKFIKQENQAYKVPTLRDIVENIRLTLDPSVKEGELTWAVLGQLDSLQGHTNSRTGVVRRAAKIEKTIDPRIGPNDNNQEDRYRYYSVQHGAFLETRGLVSELKEKNFVNLRQMYKDSKLP